MIVCAGKCGREATGHYDSGQPDLDVQHVWCDRCKADLAVGRIPAGLREFGEFPVPPLPCSPMQLSAAGPRERKILNVEQKAATAVATDTGTFTGYLAAFGRDHSGDTIMGPSAVADTVAAVNQGDLVWHLTDSHSQFASDVVATVLYAAVDHRGVQVVAKWAPTERAQQLRAMTRDGHRLGLSIDYLPDRERPDGQGGRYLDRVSVFGGAVTPHPMNSACFISESKTGSVARVVTVSQEVAEAAGRNNPERQQEDALLAAVSWPPPGLFDRETSLALVRGVAASKAVREQSADYEAARVRARRDQDQAYSSNLAEWMAAHKRVARR